MLTKLLACLERLSSSLLYFLTAGQISLQLLLAAGDPFCDSDRNDGIDRRNDRGDRADNADNEPYNIHIDSPNKAY